jgi:hypothetical protein
MFIGSAEKVLAEDTLPLRTHEDYSLLTTPSGLVFGKPDLPNALCAMNVTRP